MFFVIYPTWCSLTFLCLWFGGWHSFGRNSLLLFLQMFLLFLSLFSFQYVYIILSWCTVIGYSVLDIFFSLLLCFESFYWHILKLREVSSAMSNLLMSPSALCFVKFLLSSISFWFFLRISSLLKLPLYSCLLFFLIH